MSHNKWRHKVIACSAFNSYIPTNIKHIEVHSELQYIISAH